MTSYKHASVRGKRHFYREDGPESAPAIVLLHGFPSSSHMFRDLIPKLADKFHIFAPDYVGFGYSDMPSVSEFEYTFDNLAAHVEELLLGKLGLKTFSIYVQDYGAPIGYRIASKNPAAIDRIIVQNGNAYVEGIGAGFDAVKPLWKNRNPKTEATAKALLTLETTKFQYVNGVKDESRINPDSYYCDQMFLDRPGNDAIQINLFHDYQSNLALYDGWHTYFRKHRPRMLITWGINDVFFTVEGAKAYLRDLPNAEIHLIDTGHFALEDNCSFIAERIRNFFA
jgi:pimeloyl-ACP methyl ester carboxylesterase